MKATREYRRWINKLRKRFSKRNGVVSGALMDNPKMERKMSSVKKSVYNLDRDHG